MTAELAHKTDTCGSCGNFCGEVRYRLKSGLIRCKACAAKIGPVPELVLVQPHQVQHPVMGKFSTFEARRAWKAVKQDYSARRIGSE